MPMPSITNPADIRIVIVGLGYVGLPLAVEFGKHFDTLGFDINLDRIAELRDGVDRTRELGRDEIATASKLAYSGSEKELSGRNIFIVTVPTPINEHKHPDFTPLVKASQMIGRHLSKDDVVIYESTVYPGATEEVCVPELERSSGLKFNEDFTVGYSPERINPGDKERRLTNIPKVTSGSTSEAANFVDALYRSIITAGTHKAPSIKVAEASKIIENTQRDANIALINEFAMIFHRIGIDTQQVLEAAQTKWNFMRFSPGLVGGHCIGVDPYYLIQKAQLAGYHPDVLIAARRVNDGMGRALAAAVVKLMIRRRLVVSGARVLVMGFTFKENCTDQRNTRVVDLVRALSDLGSVVDVFDPLANPAEAVCEYGIQLLDSPTPGTYDAVIVAVAHDAFKDLGSRAIRKLGAPHAILYDAKGMFPLNEVDGRL